MALVRRAQPADGRSVARLHREIIDWGLLGRLGDPVVTAFYDAVIRSDVAFVYLAEEDGRPVGFAAGVCDWPRLTRRVMRAIWWPLLRALPSVMASGRWRRFLETVRYTRSGHEGVNAEYFAFGVLPDTRGRLWTASALIYAGLDEFRRRGVPRIRGVVWDQNERAVKFFEAVGFRFVSEVEIHPGLVSRTFVVNLAHSAQGA